MVVGGYMYYRLGALVLNYVHFLRPLFSKMHRLGQMNSQKNITYLETKLHFLDCTLPNVTRLSYKDRHNCHFILGGVHKLRLQDLAFFDHLPPPFTISMV